MADRFITVQERDFGAGIDQQSSENRLQPGYSESIINLDPQATGSIKTRPGYQGYLGNIPLRVKSIEYNDNTENNICLFLDGDINLSSIDLSQVRITPLIVYGRVSSANVNNAGDFKTDIDSAHYYTEFAVDLKKVFSTGTNTLEILSSEHPFATAFLFVGLTRSTSVTDTSNEVFLADSVSIDKTSFDISIDYTNGLSSDFDGFAYILDKSAEAGSTYISPLSGISAGNTATFSYTAVTHGLSNFNIIGKVFRDTGTALEEVVPDQLTISTTGTVSVTITNSSGSGQSFYTVLTTAPTAQVAVGSVAAGASTTIQITDLSKDFIFAVPYLEQTVGGTLEQVYPDSITINGDTHTATISFTNNLTTSANFQVYYIYGNIATNKLCVTGEVIGSGDVYTDLKPQLTIYGLPHSEVYGDSLSSNQGFVNQIDSYRAAGEDRLITGLGGNLFEARLFGESNLTAYDLAPEYYPRINNRMLSETVLGPVFYDSTDSPSRTRGYITTTDGATNFLTVDTITYQTGSGLTRYTLTAPDITVSGTLSTIISTVSGFEDYLTVKSAGHSRLNGTFKIKQVSIVSDTILIDVDNPNIVDSCFDEVDSGGLAGIFTEQLQFLSTHSFIAGDILSCELITNLNVVGALGDKVTVQYITEEITIPAGMRFVATRETSVIPVRTLEGISELENIVRGDMLELSGITRQLRVKYVNAEANESVTISGDGIIATATVLDSRRFAIGQTLILTNSVSYSGTYTVSGIPTETTIEFLSSGTTSESATLIGYTVEVDEVLSISDTIDSSISFNVAGRWMPIEAPVSSYDLPEKTYTTHFDSNTYSSQSILRSVMVQDNMYFVNGQDEVMKYDGQSIYRAGLFRWQPHLYCAVDTSSTGKIDTGTYSLAYSAVEDNIFTLTTAADSLKFNIGQTIQDIKTSSLYTITGIDETSGKIIVNRSIKTAASGTEEIASIARYNYYFRLNMVDRNNNIIGSAVTGSSDFQVILAEDAAIKLRLVGMPVLDIYDYDRIEVQIYRTKANDTVNFFLLTTLPLSFNNNEGYIDYTDTDADSDLVTDDNLSVALFGAELATTISEPLRAASITTAGNRLILGNIKDYPTIDMQFIQNQEGPILKSNLVASGNRRYLFKKSNTDIGTTTDNVNRFAYEFTDASSSITSIANNSGTSFTVTAANSLSAGDWVYLFHSAAVVDLSLQYSGLFQVTSATGSAFTIDFPHSATYTPGASDVDSFCVATDSADIPVFLDTDGNYNTQTGNRPVGESYEFIAVKRLANMINSSMRMVNKELYPNFAPFMIANAGGEYGFGQLVIKQPKVFNEILEVKLPNLDNTFDIFINSVQRSANSEASSLTKIYPSRVLVSYPNYPEIFDNPTAVIDSRSESTVDINAADGQEVTALIPFFGDSAFGQASKSGIITAFKENSIYLLDLSAKDALSQSLVTATPVIQKLETEGKGCTAPLSVAVTRAGIMFANFSGVYRLNRNLEIEYIGRKIERIWRERVNKTNIQYITGHHYTNGNQYKLSIPLDTDTRNLNVLVYSHTREYESNLGGSWTLYDNHPTIGWANLLDDSYFCSTAGQVFSIRRTNSETDYRDDSSSISWEFITRALDFGDSGIRKNISSVITHYRTLVTTENVSLKAALDMETQFNDTDLFIIKKPTNNDGLSDSQSRKVLSVKSSLPSSIGNYLQLKYAGSALDEPVEISGIDIRVSGRDSKGLTEAKDTKK